MYGVVWKYYPNELVKTLGRESLMYEMTDVCHEFLEGNLGARGGGGGALGYFLGGYVLPGTPNWHPILEKISPKIDTPF